MPICTPEDFFRGLDCSKRPLAFWDKGACSLLRALLGRLRRPTRTLRSPRGIFCQVHALAENDLTLFAACGRQTLRGFFETLTPEDFFRGVIFLAIFSMGRYNSSGLPRKGRFSFRFGRLHPKIFRGRQ